MDWSWLAPSLVGGLLTFGGGFAGQWWSERRANDREEREREHESFVWARAQRLEAHGRFVTAFNRDLKRIGDDKRATGLFSRPDGFVDEVIQACEDLRLLCSRESVEAANRAMMLLYEYALKDFDVMDVLTAREIYMMAMRAEFGLPPMETIEWPTGWEHPPPPPPSVEP